MESTDISHSEKASSVIIKTILLAGTLDILIAFVHYYLRRGQNPLRVFNYIASGVFGAPALTGGAFMAWCGLFFHFLIISFWTILFFMAYPRIPVLSENRVLAGASYGVLIWIAMNRIVVPMSNTPKSPFNLLQASIGMLILIVAVGIPVSLMVSKYYENRK